MKRAGRVCRVEAGGRSVSALASWAELKRGPEIPTPPGTGRALA